MTTISDHKGCARQAAPACNGRTSITTTDAFWQALYVVDATKS